jgi:hypothetical protein
MATFSQSFRGAIMIAIHTKYIPATDYRSAKIKAYNGKLSVMVSIDYSLGDVDRHYFAARQYIAKHIQYAPLHDHMVYGDSVDGKGYCFCFPCSTIGTVEVA